jgi:predicted acylesterase/phospholipase RssA
MTEPHESSAPLNRCDLVMKGGITSGVVYPMAVVELAQRYRFENIGGTSAGAIAAVITAAAEFGRAEGGFDKIKQLPDYLSKHLLSLFQPRPEFRPLFEVMLAGMTKKKSAVLAALIRAYPTKAILGLAGGALGTGLFAHVISGFSVFSALVSTGVGVAGLFALPAYALYKDLVENLPARDFGLCPGRTQPDIAKPGLCDWMADTIDKVAGLPEGSGPLTIGMLWKKGIRLQTVTTDVSSRRPYTLPMDENIFAYSPREFREIFPDRIVDFMVGHTKEVDEDWGSERGDLRLFRTEHLPVVVLARMSLSFPLLFTIVPLYRRDFTIDENSKVPRLQRCLFSDGGVSSNFPVHFFDQFLPTTPTFGISLGSWDPEREGKTGSPEQRVELPLDPADGGLLPTYRVKGLGGFMGGLFASAKDWQDSLQSILVGYRERIVTVSLQEDEGGLNLDMPPEQIKALVNYGRIAGERLNADFDLNEHRWRRFLTELPALERALAAFSKGWDAKAIAPDTLDYPDLVKSGNQRKAYATFTKPQLKTLLDRAERLADLGRTINVEPLPPALANRLPKQRARLQNRPDMEHRAGPGNKV